MTQTKTKRACSPAGEPHNHQQPDSHAVDGRSNASAMENSVYLTAMSRPCASSATNESTPDQSSSQLQEFEPSRVLVPESSLLSSLSPDLATSDGPFVPESPIQPYTPQSMSSAQSNVTGTAGHSDPMAYASQYQLLNDAESHVCDVRGWCQNSDGICSFEKDKRV